MGQIHAAKLENSPRLQRVLRVLREADGLWMTTWQIIQRARVCAVNTAIAELRWNGIEVECRRMPDGNYAYRLAGKRKEVVVQ